MKKSAKIVIFMTLSSLIIISSCGTNLQVNGAEPIANIVFKTNAGGVRTYYGMFIAQYLRNIGIEVEVKIIEWSMFVGTLLISHDYDIGIVALTPDYPVPDMRAIYTEEGYLNMFGLGRDIPYCDESEEMQNEAAMETDFETCQQLYYDWQQLMMDKIVPMLPLYSNKFYNAYWSNMKGDNPDWGFLYNLPYMYFDGYHDGQVSLDELNFAGEDYTELNPLFNQDDHSKFIWQLESYPLIVIHGSKPMGTGIVTDWERINETHYTFTLRDDVYWNPSYNITERTINSVPLSSVSTGELMVGLKGGYSDGTNQQVTAKDAVFTLLARANPVISKFYNYFSWLKGCWVDPDDDMTFHLEIDQDPSTPEHEPFAHFWSYISDNLLPEFFLNSTDPTVTYTYGGGAECTGLYSDINTTPQWFSFSYSPFGCGMYMLDYYTKGSTIVLTRSPYWFGVGAVDGSEGMTPFVKTINLRIIADANSVLTEFLAGRLESCGLDKQTYNQLLGDPRFVVNSGHGGNLVFMFYNLRRPFIGGQSNYEFLTVPGKEEYTKGVAVRKAMNYAINRVEMNNVINEGDCLIVDSVLYISFSDYYYYEIIKYDYNLCASFEWLRAAGYPAGECTPTDTETTIITTPSTSIGTETPFPVFVIVITLGAAVIVFYRKRK